MTTMPMGSNTRAARREAGLLALKHACRCPADPPGQIMRINARHAAFASFLERFRRRRCVHVTELIACDTRTLHTARARAGGRNAQDALRRVHESRERDAEMLTRSLSQIERSRSLLAQPILQLS